VRDATLKLYGPDKSLLIDVSAVKVHREGLIIEGKIMGAMPMKAVLRPEELRSGFKLLTWGIARRAIAMLARGEMSVKGKPRI
jgi:hypothetical protein